MNKLIKIAALAMLSSSAFGMTADEVASDLDAKFRYKSDRVNHWQSAQETIQRGYVGDCEDYAVLLSRDLGFAGIKHSMIVGTIYGEYHVWIKADGVCYDTFGRDENCSGRVHVMDITGYEPN